MLPLAYCLLGFTLIYFLVTTLVDLYPFNNVRAATRKDRVLEISINAPLLLAPLVLLFLASSLDLAVLGYVGAGIQIFVALSGIALWWLPYLFGVTVPWATADDEETWYQLHERVYAETVTILPKKGTNPRPNLEHVILHTLILTSGIVAVFATATI